MTTTEYSDSATTATTPVRWIVLVWAIAVIPLAWGFISTLLKAATLFE
jgi:hypothetical protein